MTRFRVFLAASGLLLVLVVLSLLSSGTAFFSNTTGRQVRAESTPRRNSSAENPKQMKPAITVQEQQMSAPSAIAAQDSDDYCAFFNTMPQKYLSFEPWPGGWNNRRLSLECAAVLAKISGRTLILPPSTRGVRDDHIRGVEMMSYEAGYNLTKMREHLNAVTFIDFLRCKSRLLAGLPYRPVNCDNTPEGSKDRFYCEHSRNVSTKAKMVAVNGGRFFQVPQNWRKVDPKGHHRSPTDLPDTSIGGTITHYQRNLLCCFSSMLYIRPDVPAHDSVAPGMPSPYILHHSLRNSTPPVTGPIPTLKQFVFGAMRDGLVYIDDVMQAAQTIVDTELGGLEGFSAIHLRRTDFKMQYPNSVLDPVDLLLNLRPLLKPNETILLASDDDHEVQLSLSHNASLVSQLGYRLVLWSHLKTSLSHLQQTMIPLVVQQVCVSARIFAPNPFSTFSGLIVRLRGYRGGIGPYYTTVRIITPASDADPMLQPKPDNLPDPLGPTWGHETKYGWEDL